MRIARPSQDSLELSSVTQSTSRSWRKASSHWGRISEMALLTASGCSSRTVKSVMMHCRKMRTDRALVVGECACFVQKQSASGEDTGKGTKRRTSGEPRIVRSWGSISRAIGRSWSSVRSIPTKSLRTRMPPSTSSACGLETSARSWLMSVGHSSGQSECAMSDTTTAYISDGQSGCLLKRIRWKEGLTHARRILRTGSARPPKMRARTCSLTCSYYLSHSLFSTATPAAQKTNLNARRRRAFKGREEGRPVLLDVLLQDKAGRVQFRERDISSDSEWIRDRERVARTHLAEWDARVLLSHDARQVQAGLCREWRL